MSKSNPYVKVASGPCKRCGAEVSYKFYAGKGYSLKNYCKSCLSVTVSERFRRTEKPIGLMTKKELRGDSKNCHWFKARLSKLSRKIYEESGRIKACEICGFDFCYHVCHIKSVEDFPDEALVQEMNSLNNLIALCPNHHAMLDGKVFCIINNL